MITWGGKRRKKEEKNRHLRDSTHYIWELSNANGKGTSGIQEGSIVFQYFQGYEARGEFMMAEINIYKVRTKPLLLEIQKYASVLVPGIAKKCNSDAQ